MKILTYLKSFRYLRDPNCSDYDYRKAFARAKWWRYWKLSQRLEQRRTPKMCGLLFSLNVLIMITNTLSKETELRLSDFFKNSIDPELMAKTIRKVNYILALSIMRDCETLETEKISLENGFYWLNELAEILNPYLDVE